MPTIHCFPLRSGFVCSHHALHQRHSAGQACSAGQVCARSRPSTHAHAKPWLPWLPPPHDDTQAEGEAEDAPDDAQPFGASTPALGGEWTHVSSGSHSSGPGLAGQGQHAPSKRPAQGKPRRGKGSGRAAQRARGGAGDGGQTVGAA